MEFNNLFNQRTLVATNLKKYIRDKGYTKVSFAKMADISRPTLDKLLSGNIDSKSTFDKHLQKILRVLGLTVDELLLFKSSPKVTDAVYSQNAPTNYQMNEKAKKQYKLLMDILDLC